MGRELASGELKSHDFSYRLVVMVVVVSIPAAAVHVTGLVPVIVAGDDVEVVTVRDDCRGVVVPVTGVVPAARLESLVPAGVV